MKGPTGKCIDKTVNANGIMFPFINPFFFFKITRSLVAEN